MAQDRPNANDPWIFVRIWGTWVFTARHGCSTFDEDEPEQRINDPDGRLAKDESFHAADDHPGPGNAKTTISAVRAVGTMASNAMGAGAV